MTTATFVTAKTALADIEDGFKKHRDILRGELSTAEAIIVTDYPDEWLIHITLTKPRGHFFSVPFGKREIHAWVKGNSQHERHGTLIATGNCIDPANDAGPIYSIWEIPDCTYIAVDLSYERLLECLRGEHAQG